MCASSRLPQNSKQSAKNPLSDAVDQHGFAATTSDLAEQARSLARIQLEKPPPASVKNG
jgi:hypothetical protein